MLAFPVAEVAVPVDLQEPSELKQLLELRGGKEADKTEEGGSGIRYKAIQQEGMRVGAQSGLAYRYGQIMRHLDKVETKLNVVYSFARFVREGKLLVPAVVQTPNQFVTDSEKNEARVIKDSVTIQEEARLISVVPTWRDYLYQDYAYPELPHRSVRPRTDAEIKVWNEALKAGWTAGISQADQIYDDRLAQLTMAVEGRHLYVTLEQKKVISPAALHIEANKVTFNGRTMNVGEVIYSIKQEANYTNSDSWRPVWTRQ